MSAFDTAWSFLKEDLDPNQTRLSDFTHDGSWLPPTHRGVAKRNVRKPAPLKRRRAPPKVVLPDEKPPTDTSSAWSKNRSTPDPEAAAAATERLTGQIKEDAGVGELVTCPNCGKYTSIPQFMNPTRDQLCGSVTVGGQCSGPV